MPKLPAPLADPKLSSTPSRVIARDDCCEKLLVAFEELKKLASVEIQTVAMCDCPPKPSAEALWFPNPGFPHVDPGVIHRRPPKTCVPFMRLFRVDKTSGHIAVAGDYTYDGRRYRPTGVVRSEAQCCDCANCGDKPKTKLVDYDLCCLFKTTELNGGLSNFQIAPGDPVPFNNQVLNTAQQLADLLNQNNYLGYYTWGAEDDCHLTLTIPEADTPPGPATGCRFRRYRVKVSMAVFDSNYNSYAGQHDSVDRTDYDTTQRNQTSTIHYWNSLVGTRAGSALQNFTGNRGIFNSSSGAHAYAPNANDLFRGGFQDVSVGNSPLDLGSQANTTAGRSVWAQKFQPWLQTRLNAHFTCLVHQLIPITPVIAPGDVRYPFTVNIDVSCDVVLKHLHITLLGHTEILHGDGWGLNDFANAGADNNHKVDFSEVPDVGNYSSTPSVNGVGGSVDWSPDCSIPLVAGEGNTGSTGDAT